MRKSKIIKWNGKEVTCKELSVSEIDTLMNSAPEPTALDMVFSERAPVIAVTMSTGLDYAELKDQTPSLLSELWDGVEEVNPFFIQMLNRLAEKGRNLTS